MTSESLLSIRIAKFHRKLSHKATKSNLYSVKESDVPSNQEENQGRTIEEQSIV